MDVQTLVKEVVFHDSQIIHIPSSFELIGKGRSASVFRLRETDLAVKVFYPGCEKLAEIEAGVYEKLDNHDFFPAFYGKGDHFIVMEYVEGITFYECLVTGVPITEDMIERVDAALDFACHLGLNPSDTHLKNMMLTHDGQVKVIDVVRFTQDFECPQWNDLKKVYRVLYRRKFVPKKYPVFFIEFIIRLYRRKLLPI
ncbi:serine/threonine protein kinase [Halobacillus litoralis]|uniref:Serine/threonine protein kinase n=1 Tax=Halobacillus litoralis TaxID=45668 RepID=A0A845DVD4_9BACI|nr:MULTISPECIES: serine/threonine protein kinase [Halobacillus]MCA1024054.1 serine/threonine protein kinase [Halobacillus litoralis]MYL21078.1 serine/threonine protein kinase [Halobacillus litoralis]MYL31386.1 serine/threonine protein kinase [Halobacillus halophilus]MYL38459.1 serine/threonine protein kinase [Halobacillus litoralis]